MNLKLLCIYSYQISFLDLLLNKELGTDMLKENGLKILKSREWYLKWKKTLPLVQLHRLKLEIHTSGFRHSRNRKVIKLDLVWG